MGWKVVRSLPTGCLSLFLEKTEINVSFDYHTDQKRCDRRF
jgi:hypothetical protein